MTDIPETVVCPKCGTENAAWVSTCRKCSYTLVDAADKRQPTAPVRTTRLGGVLVAVVAALGLAYVVVDLVSTESRIREYQELSAIQMTQLYTQASFWLLVVIAVLLLGLLLVASTR